MNRTIALTTLLAGALATSAFAATPAKTAEKGTTEKWATGQVERFEQPTNTLVLKQGTHEMTFVLASQAKITESGKSLASSDLAGLSGHEAKVRYTSQAGRKTADQVQVMERHASRKSSRSGK